MHSAITKRTIYSTAEAFEGENFYKFQDFVANHLYTVHAYLPLFQCAIKIPAYEGKSLHVQTS